MHVDKYNIFKIVANILNENMYEKYVFGCGNPIKVETLKF